MINKLEYSNGIKVLRARDMIREHLQQVYQEYIPAGIYAEVIMPNMRLTGLIFCMISMSIGKFVCLFLIMH